MRLTYVSCSRQVVIKAVLKHVKLTGLMGYKMKPENMCWAVVPRLEWKCNTTVVFMYEPLTAITSLFQCRQSSTLAIDPTEEKRT